jgi:hypothetical protein
MHTSFPKGTPLFIKTKNNTIIYGKFSDHKSGKVILEDGSELALSEVRSMSIRKLETSTLPQSKTKINFRSKN